MVEADPQPPRVLLVEDDPDQRDLVREALTLHYGEGVAISEAGTAAECLAMDLRQFDIILQDFHLPDMTGLDLLPQVLARVDLPVVFVTGESVSETAAAAIRLGAQDYIVKRGDFLFALPILIDKNLREHAMRRENERLQRELHAMLNTLRLKNVQLQDSLEKLRHMAVTDHLTGLANRRQFGAILERAYEEAVRYGHDLSCCMCDLDHYKQFNDTLGHLAGDRLLQAAADAIRGTLRTSDIAARYGGDEFVLLLPHASLRQAESVCRRLRELLGEQVRQFQTGGRSVTFSIGIASLQSDGPGAADQLIAMADRALYAAKGAGKDRVMTFRDMPADADVVR